MVSDVCIRAQASPATGHADGKPWLLILPENTRSSPAPAPLTSGPVIRLLCNLRQFQHTVAILLRQPRQGAFIQLTVGIDARFSGPALAFALLLAVGTLGGTSARVPQVGRPQPAPQVIPGAQLLLVGARRTNTCSARHRWYTRSASARSLNAAWTAGRPPPGQTPPARHGPPVRWPKIVGAPAQAGACCGHKGDPPRRVLEVARRLRLGPHLSGQAQYFRKHARGACSSSIPAGVPRPAAPNAGPCPGVTSRSGFPSTFFHRAACIEYTS